MDKQTTGLVWKYLFEQRGVTHLHYMAPLGTMPLIATLGILSFRLRSQLEADGSVKALLKQLGSQSIADIAVQGRREGRAIGGRNLHDYVPLYFGVFTPMQYVVTNRNATLQATTVAFAEVNIAKVFEIEDVWYTDGNAASNGTSFYQGFEGISQIEWDIVLHENACYSREYKRRKCAEVLVPDRVPPECIERYLFMTKEGADAFCAMINQLIHSGFLTYSGTPIQYDTDHFYSYQGGRLIPNG
jgi:hypothetical protein